MRIRLDSLPGIVLMQLVTLVNTLGQVSFHHFAEVTASPDRAISLELAGTPPPQFNAYFDTYILDVSSNAIDWRPLARLVRTNNSANRLVYVDAEAARHESRFYRVVTNHGITPFPKPNGPYAVGTISKMLTDTSRSGRYDVRTNSSFMMTLWYPARDVPGFSLAPYIEPKLAPAFADLYGISRTVLARLHSQARTDAPVARTEAPYPVVIYSHGFRVGRRDNTARCEELASHGYVIVALDHADCLATVLSDDQVLKTTISKLSAALFESDVTDVKIVLAALSQMNREDPVFADLFDLQHVGTFGWSYGGGVAAEICRTDERVKATILLDAYLQNAHEVAWLGIQKPFLGIYNESSAFTTPVDLATRDAYWMRIKNTQHQHFADWLAWMNSPTDAGRRAAAAIDACILAFLDRFLKNRDNRLLEDPAAIYPEVLNFVRK